MAEKTVLLTNGQTLRLTWTKWHLKNLSVYVNDELLWAVENRAALRLGRRLPLSDGSSVTVILSDPHGLEVWYNGREMLSDSPNGYVGEPTRSEKMLRSVASVGFDLIVGFLIEMV